MADDKPEAANTGIAQADALYRGFPEFSAWAQLSPSDIDLWDRFADSLEERRKTATPEALQATVEVAVRAAALDTGAIEGLYTVDRGFTMTVAVQGLAWEQMIEERGADVRELFEAQLEAYELVLDAVTRKLPITEAWIRALHEKLCAPQKMYRVLTDVGWQEQDLPKGQYKTRPNHVRLADGTYHAYAPVDQVASEMHRLIEQIRTPEFEAAHPVLQASYCHYAFVLIHPFADGNGRVARALASIFFYRAESIPLVIFASQRPAYLDALHAADLGDLRPLISFFRDRGIDTMQMIIENLSTGEVSSTAASQITKLLKPLGGLTREHMDALALRLLNEAEMRVKSEFDRLSLMETISLRMTKAEDGIGPIPGYRRVMPKPKPAISVVLENDTPARVQAEASFRVLVAEDAGYPFAFLLETRGAPGVQANLETRLEDVNPEISTALEIRLDLWAKRFLGQLLSTLEQRFRASLKDFY